MVPVFMDPEETRKSLIQ